MINRVHLRRGFGLVGTLSVLLCASAAADEKPAASRTYIGVIDGAPKNSLIAVVVEGNEVLAYACSEDETFNTRNSRWFRETAADGEMQAVNDGVKLAVTIGKDEVAGTLTGSDKKALNFKALQRRKTRGYSALKARSRTKNTWPGGSRMARGQSSVRITIRSLAARAARASITNRHSSSPAIMRFTRTSTSTNTSSSSRGRTTSTPRGSFTCRHAAARDNAGQPRDILGSRARSADSCGPMKALHLTVPA